MKKKVTILLVFIIGLGIFMMSCTKKKSPTESGLPTVSTDTNTITPTWTTTSVNTITPTRTATNINTATPTGTTNADTATPTGTTNIDTATPTFTPSATAASLIIQGYIYRQFDPSINQTDIEYEVLVTDLDSNYITNATVQVNDLTANKTYNLSWNSNCYLLVGADGAEYIPGHQYTMTVNIGGDVYSQSAYAPGNITFGTNYSSVNWAFDGTDHDIYAEYDDMDNGWTTLIDNSNPGNIVPQTIDTSKPGDYYFDIWAENAVLGINAFNGNESNYFYIWDEVYTSNDFYLPAGMDPDMYIEGDIYNDGSEASPAPYYDVFFNDSDGNFISGAVVKCKDLNTSTEVTLTEYTGDEYYGATASDGATVIPGHEYKVIVDYNSVEYTGTAVMPGGVTLANDWSTITWNCRGVYENLYILYFNGYWQEYYNADVTSETLPLSLTLTDPYDYQLYLSLENYSYRAFNWNNNSYIDVWSNYYNIKLTQTSIEATETAVAVEATQTYEASQWTPTNTPTVAATLDPIISLNKTVTVSSIESGSYIGPYAVDGDAGTRWCSDGINYPAWIYVDLGDTYNITGVVLRWEACASGTYYIDSSPDAVTWTNIVTATGLGNFTVDIFSGLLATGRYVRVSANASQGTSGISLYEFEVHGTP
jgi:hypothetical protein